MIEANDNSTAPLMSQALPDHGAQWLTGRRGLSNAMIAVQLHLPDRTIENRVAHAHAKTGGATARTRLRGSWLVVGERHARSSGSRC